MKYLILCLIFIFQTDFIFSQSDYSNFDHFYGIQLNTGITFFDFGPLKKDFRNYVNSYKENYNLPLEIQHLYPANISWSVYLFWYFSPNVSLIIGPEYTSTRAYSRYEDYAGTLDIKSEIKEIYLSLGLRVHLSDIKIVQPFFGINFGVTQIKYEEEINLNINGIQLSNNYNKLEDSDYGYIIEPNIGLNYNIRYCVVQFIASYKYVNLEKFQINPNNINLGIGFQKGMFN